MTRVRALRAPPDPDTIVLAISGPIGRADVTRLCERALFLIERSEAMRVVCDVADVAAPSVAAVDVLARLQLTARRLGRNVTVRHACTELRDLMELAGLRDVVPLCKG